MKENFARLGGLIAAAALLLVAGPVRAADIGKPEKTKLTIGLAVPAASFLPVYVAAAHTWKAEGLTVEVISFRGDSEVSQALAGDSIDLSLQSIDGLIHLINSNQPVRGFYAGFHQADFSWVAQPNVKKWEDLKGGTIGVSTFGSLTDALTRYALRKHGLEPGKDVQVVQAGPSASSIQALKSGRLTAGIQSTPTKWVAEDAGLTVLATMDKEIAPKWPKHSYMAKLPFIEKNPNTVKAFLRGHVAAIRLAEKDRAMAVKLMVDQIKYQPAYAERAYDEDMPWFDERGRLPDKQTMDVFWQIQVAGGEVTEPWAENKYMDDRFMKTFDDWAP